MGVKSENEQLREYLKSLPRLSDKGRAKRIEKAKSDFRYFAEVYCPHHITGDDEELAPDLSVFRNFAYKELPEKIKTQRKIELTAYRGAAKTTVVTRLFTLWLLVSGRKRYPVIISSTESAVLETMEFFRIELEDNASLVADFEIVQGDKWAGDEFTLSVGGTRAKMKGAGVGKRIRGLNYFGTRPDHIVLDDVENDENVESKEYRNKIERWVKKVILKLPARKSKNYNILIVGTILHYDSVLARIGKRGDFETLNFPLVIEWPEHIDSITKENLCFELVKDAVLDDPDIDVVEVFADFLEDKDSFYSEMQNTPIDPDGATFAGYKTYIIAPEIDAYFVGIDPSLGKKKGDYFGIATLGYNQKEKRYYLSAKGYKIKPEAMIDIIIELAIALISTGKPFKIAIETVAFQEFFKSTLVTKALERCIHLPIIEIKNSVNKEIRIDSLSPHTKSEVIRVDENSHLLIEELKTYPKAPHDDLLDAAEMAWRIAYKGATLDMKALERIQKIYGLIKKGKFDEC